VLASSFRDTPSSSCISSLRRPLLSRNAIFLSVDASFTSSSSRNLFACSTTFSRLSGSGAGFSSSFAGFSEDGACHESAPPFFSPGLKSLILYSIGAQERVFGAFIFWLSSVPQISWTAAREAS
jgi:hypothetical protein